MSFIAINVLHYMIIQYNNIVHNMCMQYNITSAIYKCSHLDYAKHILLVKLNTNIYRCQICMSNPCSTGSQLCVEFLNHSMCHLTIIVRIGRIN